jgi:hypothetical protein
LQSIWEERDETKRAINEAGTRRFLTLGVKEEEKKKKLVVFYVPVTLLSNTAASFMNLC